MYRICVAFQRFKRDRKHKNPLQWDLCFLTSYTSILMSGNKNRESFPAFNLNVSAHLVDGLPLSPVSTVSPSRLHRVMQAKRVVAVVTAEKARARGEEGRRCRCYLAKPLFIHYSGESDDFFWCMRTSDTGV